MAGPAATDAPYSIVALGPDTWDAFAGLAERHNGGFFGCWCTWFHPDCAERGVTAEGNRDLKKQWVEDGVAHAALVVDGDEAVAWAQYGTPEELPRMKHRKQYDAELDVLPDYRVTCIFVDRRYRRGGMSDIALRGALDLIAQAGGGLVEGYPHDIPPGKKMSASFIYSATRHVFERAGFDYIRPKGQGNCVMRRNVDAAPG
jgi:hypothetical protein